MRRAEAVRQALIRMRSSMMWSLMLPGSVDWMMKTAWTCQYGLPSECSILKYVPSSSRTDSPMDMLLSLFEYCNTMIFASSIPSLRRVSFIILYSHLHSLQRYDGPLSNELSQRAMTVASQELDGVGRHADATREKWRGWRGRLAVSLYKYLRNQNSRDVQATVVPRR